MPDFIQALVDNTELLSAGGLPGITPVANPGIPSPSVAVSVPGLSAAQTSSAVTLSESALATGELDPEPLLEPKSQPIGGLLDSKTTEISEKTTDPIVGDSTEIFTKTTEDSTANTGDHAGSLAGVVADTDPLTGERSNPTNPESKSLLAKTAISTTQSSAGGQDVTGDPLLAPTQTSATQTSATTTAETVTDSSLAIPDNFTSGVFTVGKEGEVGVDFLFDGGAYKGELAIFSLAGMEDLSVNSVDFIREATKRALSGSKLGHVVIADRTEGAKFGGATGSGTADSFNTGDYLGLKTFQMTAGDKFAVMMSPDGSFEKLLNNPNAGGSWRPLFSLAPANPNAVIQTARIADITGDGQAFAMEDLRLDGKSDKDFNDLVFQFRGARGQVTNPEIDPIQTWRGTELGKEVVESVTKSLFTVRTPDPLPGQPIDVEFRLQNTTNNTGRVQANLYISSDDIIGDEGDIFLGKYTSAELAPGSSTGIVKAPLTMPEAFYPFWNNRGDGDYRLGLVPSTGTPTGINSILGNSFGVFNVDLAGETPDQSRAGFPATTNGRTYQGRVGGSDPIDYYEFKLGLGGLMNLSLSGVTQDVNIELLDSQNRILAAGKASANQPLNFGDLQVAGDESGQFFAADGELYRLRLTSDSTQETNYQLNLQVTPRIPGLAYDAPDALVYGFAIDERDLEPSWVLDEEGNIDWNASPFNSAAFDYIRLNEFRNTTFYTYDPRTSSYKTIFGGNITGRGITAAVLDTAINQNNILFNLETPAGETPVSRLTVDSWLNSDYIAEQATRPEMTVARNHGPNVAGIIAAGAQYQNIGIAPNANILNLEVLSGRTLETPIIGENSTSRIDSDDPIIQSVYDNRGRGNMLAVQYALANIVSLLSDGDTSNDPSVVNLSLGSRDIYDEENENDASWGLGAWIDQLTSRGVITVAAAGNYHKAHNQGDAISYRDGQPLPNLGVAYPANYQGVIGVSAVSQFETDEEVVFSDFTGTYLSMTRPALYPTNQEAPNEEPTSYGLRKSQFAPFSSREALLTDAIAPGIRLWGGTYDDNLGAMSGTSQATAVVSGVAVLAQEFAKEVLGRPLTPNEFNYVIDITRDSARTMIWDIDDPTNPMDNVPNSVTSKGYEDDYYYGSQRPLDMMGIASEILNLDGYLRKDPRTYQVAPPAVRLALPEGWLVARGSISEDTYRLLGRSDNSSSGTTSYFYEVTLHGDLYLSGEYSPVWGRRPSAYLSFRSTGVISTDVPPRTGFGPIIQRNPYSGHLGYFMLPNLSNPTTVYPSESESFIGTIDGIPTSPYLRSSNAINRIELDGDGNLSIHFNTLNSVIDGRYYDSDSPLDLSAIPILDSIPTYPSEFTTEWRR